MPRGKEGASFRPSKAVSDAAVETEGSFTKQGSFVHNKPQWRWGGDLYLSILDRFYAEQFEMMPRTFLLPVTASLRH